MDYRLLTAFKGERVLLPQGLKNNVGETQSSVNKIEKW